MSISSLLQPRKIAVRRTELRNQQSKILGKAKGRRVVVVSGSSNEDEEKYVLGKTYFEDLLTQMESLSETVEIIADRRLFNQIMNATDTLDEDLRLGRLAGVEEAFAD
jgi:hypothetical protein